MEYKPLNSKQINILEDAIKYSSSKDSNGSKGPSLASKLEEAFNGNPPRIIGLKIEKIPQYNIIASEDFKELYRTLSKQKFKGIFSKLKKAGYKGIDGKGMKDYSNMNNIQMWNYFVEIKDDLNLFS